MIKLSHYENVNVNDFINNQTYSPIRGFVKVYVDNILNTDQTKDGWLTNMTVGVAREFVSQSILNLSNINSQHVFTQERFKVDCFGIGSGGSIINQDGTITLNGPNICDIGLYDPIQINENCFTANSNNGNAVEHVAKLIMSDGEIYNSRKTDDSLNCISGSETITYYTVGQLICNIGVGEPISQSGQAIKIDEAMLFLTNDDHSIVHPFAHICFAPKYIEPNSPFRIEWFIIC